MKLWNKIKKHADSTPNKDAFNTLILEGLCYEKVSYLDLVRAVQRCFYSLPEVAGMRVGLMISNRPLWAIYDLALTLKGATVVPVAHFFSETQVRHIINDAQLKLLIKEDFSGEDEQVFSDSMTMRLIKADTLLEKPCGNAAEIPLKAITPRYNPSAITKIIYTSGTTAAPKGVMVSQAAIDVVTMNLAEKTRACAEDRHLTLLPLATLIETIGGLYVPLYAGATIMYPEINKNKASLMAIMRSPLENAKLIRKTRVTTLNLVPAILEGLIKVTEKTKRPIPKSLRFIACGGAVLPSSLMERAKALGIPLYQGFGLSECTTVVSLNSPENNRPGSVGTPLPHVTIRIADDGEIIVRSNALMTGYLNNDGKEINEWPTGDLGYMDDDGFLYVSGRKDSAFATSAGRNVSPEWIEGELLSSHAVSQALVFGAGLDHPSAIIVPEIGWLKRASQEIAVQRKESKELLQEPLIREILIKELNLSMQSLPEYATVKEFIFTESPFTKKTGEVGPSGALNRKLILKRYADTQKLVYSKEASNAPIYRQQPV